MSKPKKGVCVFCGKYRQMHVEDIIPFWMGDLFKALNPNPGKTFVKTKGFHQGVPSLKTSRVGGITTFKLKGKVCRPCNGGWMGMLERLTGPILTPLIEGTPRTLSVDQQEIVATWMTLKALTFDLLEHQMFEPEMCHEFYANPAPLPEFQVFLATYVDHTSSPMAGATLMRANTPMHKRTAFGSLPAGAAHAQLLTLVPFNLILQSVLPRKAARNNPNPYRREEFALLTLQIWPAKGPVDWPPPVRITKSALSSFASDKPDDGTFSGLPA